MTQSHLKMRMYQTALRWFYNMITNSLKFFTLRCGVSVSSLWICVSLKLFQLIENSGSESMWFLRLEYERSCSFDLGWWNARGKLLSIRLSVTSSLSRDEEAWAVCRGHVWSF